MKDTKSTSGYVFTLGGAAISWKSSKKTCIAISTMEYEFIALDKAGEEAEWLRQFLEDIPIWPKPVPAICIHCDSQFSIGRAQNDMYNGKEDIPIWPRPVPTICIHCDSQSAIDRAQNDMYNGKSRHIRRRHDTVRQLLSNGIISIDYIKSKDNLADPLTKCLTREQVNCTSRGMGLKPMTKESP